MVEDTNRRNISINNSGSHFEMVQNRNEKGTRPVQQLFGRKFAKQPPAPPPFTNRTPGATPTMVKAPSKTPTHQAALLTGPTPNEGPSERAKQKGLAASDGLPLGTGVVLHPRNKLTREAQTRTKPGSLEAMLLATPATPAGPPGRLESTTTATTTSVGPSKDEPLEPIDGNSENPTAPKEEESQVVNVDHDDDDDPPSPGGDDSPQEDDEGEEEQEEEEESGHTQESEGEDSS